MFHPINPRQDPKSDKISEPIHLSPEGYVVEPLPSGKVLKN